MTGASCWSGVPIRDSGPCRRERSTRANSQPVRRREVYEETGVRIAVERLAGVALREVTYPHGDVCQFLTVWFCAKPIGGHAAVHDGESSAAGWYSPEELPGLDAFDQLRIDTALADDAPAWFAADGTTTGSRLDPEPGELARRA
jgi:8-oxo-dGTP diphosphatase